MKHRKLPLPDHFNSPTPGICRWCNKKIGPTKTGRDSKSSWHQSCVAQYKFYHWPSYARKLVWRRDHGKCSICKKQCEKKGSDGWDMDHIIPLHLANYEIWAWEMENLQTLCKNCHKAKTASEASARSVARRAK